ncbi:K02A2.6-like [Cordylochernes scorpioides]|uniref:K02A2.6-like n=1 Tax=Cordylochernes scorpioides TaxID=51811 RepID=A0ABY6L914_9ARAC|nr:K02A2.6-like [Cordylochernes scorpioides]
MKILVAIYILFITPKQKVLMVIMSHCTPNSDKKPTTKVSDFGSHQYRGGFDFITSFGSNYDIVEKQKELNQLLKENQALFSQHETDIGRIAVQHKIHTIEHPPISCRPYRRPLAEYDEIKRQVEELIKKGLIRESQSPWAFPVVLVSKKDGSQRMCIDYRKLNAITIDDKQPLPYIQDMFDRLHNAKYFTTLDIAWGYWHVEIHPDSVEKTAFITNDGHYEFLVMPFGLKNAPSTFQRIIQHIIGNLLWNGVCNYQDDILIYSSTQVEEMLLCKTRNKIFRSYHRT